MGATHDKLKHHAARGKLQDTRGVISCVQKSIEHLEGMVFSVSSDEARIRREWLDYEAKVIALHGKPAPPELEAQQFRLLTEACRRPERTFIRADGVGESVA